MKRLFAGLCALALLSVISLLATVQAQAQTTADDKRPLSYDVAKEVTINGTVSSVIEKPSAVSAKPSAGMIMGSHLLVATSDGPVDASLGRVSSQGKGAVPIAAGQQIEMTGVMKTIKSRQVFLVRTVTADGHVYTIRNEHGFPVSPQAREHASRKTAGEGL
jgi:hypothetical protein